MREQGVVGQVGGRDLQGRDAVVDEGVDARRVPGGAHDVDADVPAVVEDLEELVGGEVEAGEQVEGVLRAEVLAGAARSPPRYRASMSRSWNFTASAPDALGEVDELLGELDRPVVVDADLGDEKVG